jgi:hypothetical protein
MTALSSAATEPVLLKQYKLLGALIDAPWATRLPSARGHRIAHLTSEVFDDTPIKATTLFDATSYGSDTFEKPDASKKKTKPATKTKKRLVAAPLDETISDQERVEFYTRPYEPTDFDKPPPAPTWLPKFAKTEWAGVVP